MTYSNKFKCGSKIWRKLDWPGRAVYNEVYGTMIKNQDMFRHRGKSAIVSLLAKEDWEVVCHNAACTASWAADKAAERFAA